MANRQPSQGSMKGAARKTQLPRLESGDRLDQATFHARYEAMPESFRAELIGGIVYMPSPLLRPHAYMHGKLMYWLCEYEIATSGTEAYDNVTVILAEESEPQPDACLVIIPPGVGQTRNQKGYLAGPPEWVGEIASSTEAIDLHGKLRDYEAAGVQEYMVAALRQEMVFWFVRRRRKFKAMLPGSDGTLRSQVFPGLWLDPAALLQCDGIRLLAVLRKGLATREDATFVTKLAGGSH